MSSQHAVEGKGKSGVNNAVVGSEPARSIKSSSEILNELFGTVDANFDEIDETALIQPLSSAISYRKKHSKNRTKTDDVSNKKKKKSKHKSEKKVKRKIDSDKKRKSQTSEIPHEIPATIAPEAVAEDAGQSMVSTSIAKYPSIQFRGKTILLDIEEGEITEDVDRKRKRKKKSSENVTQVDEKRKRKHSAVSSASRDREHGAASSSKHRHDSHLNMSEPKPRRHSGEAERQRDRHRSRSRSPHRDSHRSQSPYRNDRRDHSSFQACRWERERVRDFRSRTPENSGRRLSSNHHDWQRYNGSHGFGYRGRSRSPEEYDHDYRHNRNYRRRSRSRSHSSDRYPSRLSRSHNRERSTLRRLHPDDIIDKKVLLEIARKNASKLMRSGVLPTDIFSRDQILAIKAGGKSVEELTEYCKRMAKRDANGDANSSSDEDHPIHHPFTVKDRAMPGITMNIRNSIPLQIRTPHELAIENAKLKIVFPVSSGTQHRYKELEWKPVDDDDEKQKKEKKKKEDLSKALLPLDAIVPVLETEESSEMQITLDPKPSASIDIGAIISRRLRAVKDLEQNPDNAEAKEMFESASSEMKKWAEAKALEPKFLTPAELLLGPQAWAKSDQLKTASALQGGMGMHLLQRMGWSPGEGLGKNKEGSTEPLALDIKMDKKGLATTCETKGPSLPTVFDLTGKHPVSSLMELCAKRRWGDPHFELILEHGPSHKPQFVYKVTVNGVEYQPCVASKAKKEAKHNAAAFCLQSLGLLPMPKLTAKPKPAELLITVPLNTTTTASAPTADSQLMPPPPPPPALQKLLEFPLPPQVSTAASLSTMGDNTEPLAPPPLPPPLPLMEQKITMPNGFNRFAGQQAKDVSAGRIGSRLMELAGTSPEAQISHPAPIIQVPLPPSSIQGFPGLTTF